LAIGGITPKASAVKKMMFLGWPARPRSVGDEIERVGRAGILGLAVVIEIGRPRVGIERHVLQHGAETVGGGVDFRLGLGGQPDALGVAAALEVEHAVRPPAVLVVANQRAVGIGRERGLAGAGQSEKQRHIAVPADVGGAVHRHHAVRRQIEIERGEYRLLHLAGVGGVADQNDLAAKVDGDDGVAAHAVPLGIGLEGGKVNDGQLGNKIFEFRRGGANQELADEQRMPGQLGIDPRLDPKLRMGAAVEVLSIEHLAARVRKEILVQQLELLGRDLAIALPPDGLFGQRIANRVLVLGRAPGMHAGLGAQRSCLHDRRFAIPDRVLIERRLREVPVNAGQLLKAELVSAMGAVAQTCFLHDPPRWHPARSGRHSLRVIPAGCGSLTTIHPCLAAGDL